MATGRSSFAKRQRDMAKKAKAAAKREKRFDKDSPAGDSQEAAAGGPKRSNDEIMALVADLHRRYDDGQMDLDTFDEERAALMAEISVD